MPERHDCGADAAAYVLSALEEHEAKRFEQHLESCAVCRDEVRSLQLVADALPLAAPPVAVPAGLKRSVMREVGARSHEGSKRASRRRIVIPRPAIAGFGALALAAGALATIDLSGGGPATRVVQARVLAASGSASIRLRDGHAELLVRGMAPPPSDKIYEVWLKRGDAPPAPTSALFSVTWRGEGAVDVPGDLHGVTQVLVTPEPLGGSAAPTHAPVIEATL